MDCAAQHRPGTRYAPSTTTVCGARRSTMPGPKSALPPVPGPEKSRAVKVLAKKETLRLPA
ncbi:MAG: hypothetical protein J7M17_02335 [Anaerolineae bacterium]|nr:hypothetical protein [Anaerolineae bacterium]